MVSLAPALTQMIVDLGLGSQLVATAENDAAAPPGLPVVGHYQDINTEMLLLVEPTHVVTMATQQAVPQQLQALAAAGRFVLVAYPYPITVSDVVSILYEPNGLVSGVEATGGGPSLGVLLNQPKRAREVITTMHTQLEWLGRITRHDAYPRVLMVIGLNPLMASGPGTVHDQLLSYCGAHNAAADAAVGAPVYDKEKLTHAKPDVIMMLLPGAAPLGSIDTDPRLAHLRGLPIPAVANRRVVLIDDPLVHLPASNLARTAAAMAQAIHPDLTQRIRQALGVGVEPGAPTVGPAHAQASRGLPSVSIAHDE